MPKHSSTVPKKDLSVAILSSDVPIFLSHLSVKSLSIANYRGMGAIPPFGSSHTDICVANWQCFATAKSDFGRPKGYFATAKYQAETARGVIATPYPVFAMPHSNGKSRIGFRRWRKPCSRHPFPDRESKKEDGVAKKRFFAPPKRGTATIPRNIGTERSSSVFS
jgi:hypothetical protein